MLSLLAGDAECFRVLSSPNPAAQGQHNVCGSGCGSGYGADPQDLALLCAPAISSCQHLHLWGAFDRTTEASPASKQSGCTRMSHGQGGLILETQSPTYEGLTIHSVLLLPHQSQLNENQSPLLSGNV